MKNLFSLVLVVSSLSFAAETSAPRKVVVGLASNFSGVSVNSYNPFGGSFRKGAELALSDFSARFKAKGIEIELKEFDYGSNLLEIRTAVEAAVASNAIAVVGYEFSDDALMAAPAHKKGELVMITPSASADRLGTFGGYVRQTTFTNKFQGNILSRFARTKLKAKRAVVIAATDCAYCMDLGRAFSESFVAQGGTIKETKEILSALKDADVALSELDLSDVDVIVVPNHELTSARVIRSLLKRGVQKPFLGGDGWRTLGSKFRFGALGDQFEGYMVAHWHASVKSKASTDFVKRYEKAYGSTPNDSAVLTYDTVRMLLQAIEKVGPTVTRASLEKAMSEMRSFDGVVGRYNYPPGVTAPDKTAYMLKSYPNHFSVEVVLAPESRKAVGE